MNNLLKKKTVQFSSVSSGLRFIAPNWFEVSLMNNNKKFRSFESKENIHKKEVGPYHGFDY